MATTPTTPMTPATPSTPTLTPTPTPNPTVCLRNSQDSSLLLRHADKLRRAGRLCDAEVVVGNQAFPAHSLVLTCASKRLEALLIGATHRRCTLDFLSAHTFQQILEFTYACTLEAPVEDLGALQEAAALLQMDQLRRECQLHLDSLGGGAEVVAGGSEDEEGAGADVKVGIQRQKVEKQEEEEVTVGPPDRPLPLTKPRRQSYPPMDPAPPSPKTAREEEPAQPSPAAINQDLVLSLPARGSVIASTRRPPAPPRPPSSSSSSSPSSPSSSRTQWLSAHGLALANTDWLTLRALHPSHTLHPPSLVAYPFQLPPPVFPLLTPSQPRSRDPFLSYASFLHPSFVPGAMGGRELEMKHQGLLSKAGVTAVGGTNLVGTVPDEQTRKHHNVCKTYRCEYCGKEFLDSLRLRIHSVIHSGSSQPALCPFCSKVCDSQGALRSHVSEHTRGWGHMCEECGRPFPSATALRRHQRSHTGELSCECDYCGRCFRDDSSLRSHKRMHTGEKPYQCSSCNKRFSLKHQLDTHHRVHTGEKPFECRLCGQRSRDYSAMIKHLRTHSGAGPYQCTVCLEFCCSLAAMQKHLKSHSADDFPPDWSIGRTYLYTCHS
ncbi:zinc finger and BTB domain-containing protein 16 [Amia ocellicauda]|uniref:zinc finger and BTB domain-containing protein 16 n=1 Tax=Amia ocellicauda TaxID=2972642 RepID=UPI003464C412